MNLFEFKDVLYMSVLVLACWYSYKKGFMEGLENGVDKSLLFLNKKGYITLTRDANGEIIEFESKD